ncbi:MAG: DUF523 domain-containing protein [Clostridiales bacterium]|nr:DUF523 domain-containing protein [Clostridiales bacterium]
MRILVSACLLGLDTRYDGKNARSEAVLRLLEGHEAVPVCPEQLGGLPTPRPPCELAGGRVLDIDGQDRTAAFERGAALALETYRLCRCDAAILKARSPSCGKGQVYDGRFSGTTVPGNGVLAERLLKAGIAVYTENELERL